MPGVGVGSSGTIVGVGVGVGVSVGAKVGVHLVEVLAVWGESFATALNGDSQQHPGSRYQIGFLIDMLLIDLLAVGRLAHFKPTTHLEDHK